MKEKLKVSVVIPILNEEGNISRMSSSLDKILKICDYEIIFVDDGSTDNSLAVVKSERRTNKRLKYISFSRNFGHQNALRAGLEYASGDCVISMDGDMQHPPTLIPEMIKKWEEGFAVVYTVREEDHSAGVLKMWTSKLFYRFINAISEIKLNAGAADFRLLDRRVVEVIKSFEEDDLFLRGLIPWIGFSQIGISYKPEKREWGKTKYSLTKMLKLAISGITGFSIKPLRVSLVLGAFFAFSAFAYGAYAIYLKLFTHNSISGWASLLTAISFFSGVQMILIGIVGEYLGKTFMETKKRPPYLVKEIEVE